MALMVCLMTNIEGGEKKYKLSCVFIPVDNYLIAPQQRGILSLSQERASQFLVGSIMDKKHSKLRVKYGAIRTIANCGHDPLNVRDKWLKPPATSVRYHGGKWMLQQQ